LTIQKHAPLSFNISSFLKENIMKKKVPTPAEVMHEFKEGEPHSGKTDTIVTNPKQAIAIALSEAQELEKDIAEKKAIKLSIQWIARAK
jgi:hypothetical protein